MCNHKVLDADWLRVGTVWLSYCTRHLLSTFTHCTLAHRTYRKPSHFAVLTSMNNPGSGEPRCAKLSACGKKGVGGTRHTHTRNFWDHVAVRGAAHPQKLLRTDGRTRELLPLKQVTPNIQKKIYIPLGHTNAS